MESACKKYWNGTMLSRVRYRRLSRLLALWIAVSGGVAAVAWTEDVAAAAVIAVSYDMPNGNGTATGGFFNYWDRDYTGNGSVAPISAPHTNDGEALSGGLGDLTDGVIATQDWFFVESAAGDGPYVGWQDIDPRITFHFASSVTIDTVTLHLADSTFSDVEPANNANIDAGAGSVTGDDNCWSGCVAPQTECRPVPKSVPAIQYTVIRRVRIDCLPRPHDGAVVLRS